MVRMTEDDLNALRAAAATLEHPGLAARLGEIAGKPIELVGITSGIGQFGVIQSHGAGGRPPSGRDFHRQKARNPARCQRSNVCGLMIFRASSTPGARR
jgi:hypothetical protein